jgi:RimJ/RimL family protein N-acetyltransferase
MTVAEPTVELVSTGQIELFLPILKEIDFGDRFLLSMLHWCGIGQWSTPLEFWEVFLLPSSEEIVGVSGLYRQPGMPANHCWLGWFGIRPGFRRRRYASVAMRLLANYARQSGCSELLRQLDL